MWKKWGRDAGTRQTGHIPGGELRKGQRKTLYGEEIRKVVILLKFKNSITYVA